MKPWRRMLLLLLAMSAAAAWVDSLARAEQAEEPAASSAPGDPYKDGYAGYVPDFLKAIDQGTNWTGPFDRRLEDAEQMKLSSEKYFYTLNILDEDARAAALVEAGLKKQQQGQHREALAIYQQVIEKFPHSLYRVSDMGVFVPVSQYCQRRILRFPASDLAYYRTLYDARAKEAFDQAQRQFSLLGLSDVVDTMLATSYGGRAMLQLGDAALDAGHFLAALEYYQSVRDWFPDRELHTPELQLKIAYCTKMLDQQGQSPAEPPGKSQLSPAQLEQFQAAVEGAKVSRPEFHSQTASGPHAAADDYTLLPPSDDPLGIAEPVWKYPLPASRNDFFVYSQPVVTDNSVIYRHKNIVYCRSILGGEYRWIYDKGGRATWQNWGERQYPQEDVLVQDGLVFTTINEGGPSLVALDVVTGQLRWAYGPSAATNQEQARMRFEASPCGGPRTVYASFVLDNIEGETHTDTQYGVIAFESTTGRVQWQRTLSRLTPGKFSGGFAESRRNRIRSFTSPPLYHQGTVYYNTSAGAICALDALSGRVKWMMRYPYYPDVHDATRQFGRGGEVVTHSRVYFTPHSPMFWYNQRPLMAGERLLVAPVDTNLLLCLDRRSGKVLWSTEKKGGNSAYILGLTEDDLLAIAYSGRAKRIGSQLTPGPLHLLDPATGKLVWEAPDVVLQDDQPVMTHYVFASPTLHFNMNESWFELSARPHMTQNGRVYLPMFRYVGYPIFGYVANLGCIDLRQRQVVARRRYYSGEILARADTDIRENGPEELAGLDANPAKNDETKARMAMIREVIADTVPVNAHGPFLPFSRITLRRYGVPFELRMSARSVEMVYDRAAVDRAIAGRHDPQADFARAELAIADSRLDDAAALLVKCLDAISSEDLDFRATINQQLYRVHQQLARRAIRGRQAEAQMASALGMSRTAGQLSQEIESLFAVAEAQQQRGELDAAARSLRTVIANYNRYEFPVAPVVMDEQKDVIASAGEVIDRYDKLTRGTLFGEQMSHSLQLMRHGLPLYLSTLSPLPKTMNVRAGEFASLKLRQMAGQSPEFSQRFAQLAGAELDGVAADELPSRLGEFPGTPAAQRALEKLLADAQPASPAARRLGWQLADAARVAGLDLPAAARQRLRTEFPPADESLRFSPQGRTLEMPDEEGAQRLVLERRGRRDIEPHLLLIGSRIRKRLDNKFALTAISLDTNKTIWETGELRLKGKGAEPGFFEAMVYDGLVVVHGLYDVLAFSLDDGQLRWRYRVPFDFEIQNAAASGDLLLLAGVAETIALYVPTESETGEVAWRAGERGSLYGDVYVYGDRLVTVRKLPFNVTVRYRLTGQLIGRMDLADLSLQTAHPLLEDGPAALPAAHHGRWLLLTDGWYYSLIDVENLRTVWKRPIDANDVTRAPPLRFAVSEKFIAVLKEDYDQKALYMLSAETGEVLWRTDPKDAQSPRPMHSLLIDGQTIFGIELHPGQGFYLVGRQCLSGELLFRQEVGGYQARPQVRLRPRKYGGHLVCEITDRQNFQLQAFDAATGKPAHTIELQGVPPFGVHGRMSATVQNNRLVLMSKNKLAD